MTLESGRRLGPYEIVASIGAGGMGEVYRARDTRLARTVAVKILPAALSGNAQLRQRFEREAKVISSLNHPHICTLFDVGSDSGVDYLVLEHLEGETLDQKVARGALPLDDVFRYAIEIADALDKAHRRGITHRDLKPSNVMITKSGSKLLDFGLARPSDGELDAAVSVFTGETVNKAITTEGTIVGTFQYMAPEQVEGKPADARSGMGGVYAASLDSPDVKRILDIQSTTVYARPGWLLYQHEGALFAQKFDASKLEKIGTPIRIVDSVGYFPRWGQGAYHASSSALLAYHGGTFSSEGSLVRVEANGQSKALDVGGYNLDLSRDGSRIAFTKIDREAQTSDIWVHDLRRGVTSRVTFDKKADQGPVWSPDGHRLVYVRNGDATAEILTCASSGAGDEKRVFGAPHPLEVIDWSPDGRHLLLESFSEAGRSDLVTLDLGNPQKLQPFVATPFREESGRFSPDGKWIAYISAESGEMEVYAQPFPPDGRRVKISNGGGNAPRWRRNGKELFYVTRADQLMSVELQGGDPMNAGMPREAFRGVSNDLVVEPSGESVITAREPVSNPEPIVAITNWTQRLEK